MRVLEGSVAVSTEPSNINHEVVCCESYQSGHGGGVGVGMRGRDVVDEG